MEPRLVRRQKVLEPRPVGRWIVIEPRLVRRWKMMELGLQERSYSDGAEACGKANSEGTRPIGR